MLPIQFNRLSNSDLLGFLSASPHKDNVGRSRFREEASEGDKKALLQLSENMVRVGVAFEIDEAEEVVSSLLQKIPESIVSEGEFYNIDFSDSEMLEDLDIDLFEVLDSKNKYLQSPDGWRRSRNYINTFNVEQEKEVGIRVVSSIDSERSLYSQRELERRLDNESSLFNPAYHR